MRGQSTGGFISVRMILLTAVLAILVAAAIPFFVKARATRGRSACEEFVMWVEAAKQLWAAENKKSGGDVPQDAELEPYMRRVRASPLSRVGPMPLPFDASGKLTNTCPGNGYFVMGTVAKRAHCSTMQWNEEYFQERYKRLLGEASKGGK